MASSADTQKPASAERGEGTLTAADTGLLAQAEQVLIRSCMARHGFRYWPQPPATGPQFPYLVRSVTWARRNGFGREPTALLRAQRATTRYLASLPPARRQRYGVVLNGVGPGGPGVTATIPQGAVVGQNTGTCRTWAETALYRDFRAWFRAQTMTDALPPIWQAQVRSDPAYSRAVRRWARCMHAAGYRYSSPASAVTTPAGARASAREIRAAVTEAGCVRGTGLAATVSRLSKEFERPLEARYRADVAAYLRLSLAALPRARTIMRPGH